MQMPAFEIVSAERFPSEIAGYISPDTGEDLPLNRSVSDLFGIDDTVIGLFLSEYTARRQLEFVEEYVRNGSDYGITFGGIVTFGVHRSRHKVGTTHFELIAQELGIPLLRLALPEDIPEYDPKDEAAFTNNWLLGNPLVDFYFRQATVAQDGTTATISKTP